MSTQLSITLFLMGISLFLYLLPDRHIFSRDKKYSELINLMAKRAIYIVIVYLNVMNAAIMATFAQNSSIPLTSELFFYMWLFTLVGKALIFALIFLTIKDIVNLSKRINDSTRWDYETTD